MRYPVTVRGARLFGEIEWKYSDDDHLVILLSYEDGRDAEWTQHLRDDEYDEIDRAVRAQMPSRYHR